MNAYPWNVRFRLWWSAPVLALIFDHPRWFPEWFKGWVFSQRFVPPTEADMEWARAAFRKMEAEP